MDPISVDSVGNLGGSHNKTMALLVRQGRLFVLAVIAGKR